jgi:small subunit ribosomal protein S4
MARYTGSVCRLCRRYGEKLFLKGDRCFGPKCAFTRRPTPPGMGSQRRRKVSDRGLQLREKQRARVFYGLLERQFRGYYDEALRKTGVTGEILVRVLESRLDNVVYRLGFGSSRDQARQLVRHGHVRVNDRRVNIPSYQVEKGDVVALAARAAKNAQVLASVEGVKGRGVPKWLELDEPGLKGKVLAMPAREDVNFPIQEQLIVELYSK